MADRGSASIGGYAPLSPGSLAFSGIEIAVVLGVGVSNDSTPKEALPPAFLQSFKLILILSKSLMHRDLGIEVCTFF
jgi:hypothetical protein